MYKRQDINLETVVREKIGKSIGAIRRADVENITELSARVRGTVSYTHLYEYAQKLSESGVETPVLMNYTDYAIWGAFARGFGGALYNDVSFTDKTTELNFTDPDVIEGLKLSLIHI